MVGPIRRHLSAVGIPVEQSNPEYAPGQVEVNIRYAGALESADRVVAFHSFVKEFARRHGRIATFMSKPFADQSGNGFRTHHSLWKEGNNAFATSGGRLSREGLHYLAGMQARMVETTLAAATTPNAYRRRQPYSFCPINVSRGYDNRTVGLRVIEGSPESVRVEKRDGSADYIDAQGRVLEPAAVLTDACGAGPGNLVLVATGSTARIPGHTGGVPTDATAMGVVDQLSVGATAIDAHQIARG